MAFEAIIGLMAAPSTLAMMLKSYGGDIAYATRLVESFNRFNIEGIPLYIVVPPEDLSSFADLQSSNVTLLDESMFADHLTKVDINGYRAGYVNQEIVKLAFWESGLCDNYFLVDSDALFLRDFTHADFMFDDQVPFTILSEDAELQVEPEYFEKYWQERQRMIMHIPKLMNFEPRLFLTCHGHAVFSSLVLRSFKEEFLEPRGWGYVDAIRDVPFEFSWYNMWIQAREPIPIRPREPIVKTYHNEGQHLEHLLKGVTSDDLARGYVAVVVNSNYSRGMGLVGADLEKHQALAYYLTYRDLVQVMGVKVARALRRIWRAR